MVEYRDVYLLQPEVAVVHDHIAVHDRFVVVGHEPALCLAAAADAVAALAFGTVAHHVVAIVLGAAIDPVAQSGLFLDLDMIAGPDRIALDVATDPVSVLDHLSVLAHVSVLAHDLLLIYFGQCYLLLN